jgi:DNA-binding NtrC family response regulator
MQNPRLHFIRFFLERNLSACGRLKVHKPLNQAVQKAVMLFMSLENGETDIAAAPDLNDQINQIVQNPPQDLVFAALAFHLGVHSALWRSRRGEADKLLSILKNLSLEGEYREVFLLYYVTEWRIHFQDRNYAQEVQSLARATKYVNEPGALNWLLIKARQIESAIWHWDLGAAEKGLSELGPFRHIKPWQGLAPYEFLQAWYYLRKGEHQKGLEILDHISLEEMKGREGLLTKLKIRLLISANRLDEVQKILNSITPNPELPRGMNVLSRRFVSPIEFEIFRAREALARRDLDHARLHAQKAIDLAYENKPSALPEGQNLLIQIELSSKRARSARLLLQAIDSQSSRFPIEWFRLHLLEGNRSAAQDVIRKSMAGLPSSMIKEEFQFAYELTPFDLAEFLVLPSTIPIVVTKKISSEGSSTPEDPDVLPFIGESSSVQEIRKKITKYAANDSAILLTGETGTGKEVLANLLHRASHGSQERFLALNCGAMSENLIQSELFGYAKGAFTGAHNDHQGLFVAVGKGTLFLDEISSMSSALQSSLLRVLESNEIRPLGSNKLQKVQARIIAATNEPLDELVAKKQFRMDLYFRLAHLQIQLPPLRERKEDIPILAKYFLRKIVKDMELAISDEFLEALKSYSWPGNVRELKTEMERVVTQLGDEHVLTARHFQEGRKERPVFLQTEPRISQGERSVALASSGENGTMFEGTSYRVNRLDRILKLFDQKEKVTRADVIKLIQCSPKTAMLDLRSLVEKNLIRRVETSKHLKTSYYVRV